MARRFQSGSLGSRYSYKPPTKKTHGPKKISTEPPSAPSKPERVSKDLGIDDDDPRSRNYKKGSFKGAPQKQIIAEVDDTFGSLAQKLGVETQDVVKANPDTYDVKAGAVYNVPQINIPGSEKGLFSPSLSDGDDPDPNVPEWYKKVAGWITEQAEKVKGGEWAKDWIGWGEQGALPPGKPMLSPPNPRGDIFSGPAAEEYWDSIGSALPTDTTPQASRLPVGPTGPLSAVTGYIPDLADSLDLEQKRGFRGMLEGLGNIPSIVIDAILDSKLADNVRADVLAKYPELVEAGQDRPGREDIIMASETRPGLEDIIFKGEEGFVPPKKGGVQGPPEESDELRRLKIPENPSAFEAVNWLTGAGLTGTALHSAGHQLRLDRPEYWDATGGRGDVLEGMEKFIVAEFGNPDGTIDWGAAVAQDPNIIDTLDKLGYLDQSGVPQSAGGSGAVYGGKYYYRTPSYGYGGGGGTIRSRKPTQPFARPSQLGLVSWSI